MLFRSSWNWILVCTCMPHSCYSALAFFRKISNPFNLIRVKPLVRLASNKPKTMHMYIVLLWYGMHLMLLNNGCGVKFVCAHYKTVSSQRNSHFMHVRNLKSFIGKIRGENFTYLKSLLSWCWCPSGGAGMP